MNSGRWIRWATAWAPLLALVACGGGAVGDSVDTRTPTAALDASQSTAQSLVATARAGASALLPGGAVSGSVVVGQPSVTVSGDTVLIDSGTLHTDYAAGWLELDYSGWTYDAATGVASAGTITVTGITGNSAAITITPNGYSVAITVFGLTVTFGVPFT